MTSWKLTATLAWMLTLLCSRVYTVTEEASAGARREFMRAQTDAVFLVLAESLVEHAGVVSSQNNTFWRNGRFVDESYARLRPAPNLPSLTRQA